MLTILWVIVLVGGFILLSTGLRKAVNGLRRFNDWLDEKTGNNTKPSSYF